MVLYVRVLLFLCVCSALFLHFAPACYVSVGVCSCACFVVVVGNLDSGIMCTLTQPRPDQWRAEDRINQRSDRETGGNTLSMMTPPPCGWYSAVVGLYQALSVVQRPKTNLSPRLHQVPLHLLSVDRSISFRGNLHLLTTALIKH